MPDTLILKEGLVACTNSSTYFYYTKLKNGWVSREIYRALETKHLKGSGEVDMIKNLLIPKELL